MGKSSSTPAAPDPYATAGAQTSSNQDTARFNAALNRTGNTNSIGSSGWKINGTDPTTGAPLYDFQTQLAPQFEDLISRPLDTSGIYGAGAGSKSVGGGNSDVRDALYRQQMDFLQPQQDQAQTSMDANLAAQGATPGSEAYTNAQGNLMRQNEFQNRGARDAAITGATGQQAQLQNMAMQGFNAQQLQQQQPLNLFSALSGNGGNSSAQGTDLMSAFNNQYQGQLNSANAQNAANNQTAGSAASLASAYLMYLALA